MHLKEGTFLQGGRYRIVRFISSGGFGCTYEAEHVLLEKKIAIKEFFAKDFCNRDETTCHVTVGTESKKKLVAKLKGKFIDEARALSRLQHANIVRVSDVFEENGTAYYVMDYIEGKSLNTISNERGALPEWYVVKYIRQVAEALRYVHNNNRLHLDVKPANIMIDNNDNAILIDFGASKQYDEESGENTSTLMGRTPGYAPLEQMGCDVVKFMPATDIYALGATMYKLLTGVTPLSANLLASGEHLTPLPDAINKNVRDAVTAAMRSNKANRPQTIDEFLSILDGNEDDDDEVTVIATGQKKVLSPQATKAASRLRANESTNGLDAECSRSSRVIRESVKLEPSNKIAAIPLTQTNKRKSSTLSSKIIVAVAIVLVLTVVSIWGYAFLPKIDFKRPKTEEKVTEVTDESMEYNDVTYQYTGPVNEMGNAEGEGTGVYSDGTYTGEYVDGCREGEGTFVTSDGSNTFTGTFENDMYSEGTLTMDDGSYFEGTFEDNEFDTGTWYTADGKYDGEMENGQYK